MQLLFVLVLGGLVLLAVSLQRTYRQVPVHELKRRARRGDEVAALLYKAVSYGPSLQAVLWFLIGLMAAAFFLVLSRSAPAWLAFICSATLVWLGFVWLPAARVTGFGQKLAAYAAPPLAWLLNYLHPLTDRLILFVRNRRPVTLHTGLYEREDLLALFERQHVAADNRIEKTELDLVFNALTFGDKQVRDYLTPRRVVKMVSPTDDIGPVLMDELHASGHNRFPVFDEAADRVAGILYLRDLMRKKSGGAVAAAMRDDVCYVHEEQPLRDALQAVLKTHQQLLIVVNSFEEYVGIITVEDILEQIIGQLIVDEFDQYDDLRSVAARQAQKEHQQHIQKDAEPTQSEETVVESDK